MTNASVITCGRRRMSTRPNAVPFHSVGTRQEAEDLIVLNCAMDRVNQFYKIRADWGQNDVMGAVQSAIRQFRL